MQPLQRHHHFRKDLIPPTDRLAKLEAQVVSMLLETQVGDDKRDSSVAFELKHQAGVIQCGRILAAKRNLDVDLAAAGALLHDIYVIVTGSYEDHAHRGGPIAGDILDQVGPYSPAEKDIIDRIVTNHSDKHITSDDIYAEFGKDADVLDCFQYPDALDEYLMVKPLSKVKSYFERAENIWTDLGIPVPPAFKMLQDYTDDAWLVGSYTMPVDETHQIIDGALCNPNTHPFAIRKESDNSYRMYVAHTHNPTVPERSPRRSRFPDPFPQGIGNDNVMLIWPGIGRYQLLDKESAKQRGIAEEGS